MKRYQFYVGTNDKETLCNEFDDKFFLVLFDFFFESYTLEIAQGRYTMQEAKTTIKERTFIVTVIDDYDEKTLKYITSNLKILLNQESILVTEEHLTTVKFM